VVQYRLRQKGRAALYVNGRAADDLRSLLLRLLDQLPTDTQPSRWLRSDLPDELELLDSLAARASATGWPVILCDEVPSPDVGHRLFGRLRDELWRTDATWVLALNDIWTAQVLEPPADAFFELTIGLGPLTDQEIDHILARRKIKPTKDLRNALDVGTSRRPLTPRQLLQLAALPETEVGTRALQATLGPDPVSALGRPEAMVVNELRALGPTSASNEELLRRLGWTRSRAAQVLRNLEDKGVVTGYDTPNPKGGRPLRQYQLTETWA
jgi:DNA-binding MarR family transcriptional regulator